MDKDSRGESFWLTGNKGLGSGFKLHFDLGGGVVLDMFNTKLYWFID